jgi:hypothetical protein
MLIPHDKKQVMKFATWSRLAAACIIGALVLVISGTASGSPVFSVSGTYSPSNFGSTTCASVGTSGFMFRCTTTGFTSQYSGDLVGTATADFTQLIDCKTSHATGTGVETFTGSVAGVGSGMLSWIDEFSWDIDCRTFIPFNLDINSVAVKGSAGLAGLQGRLAFTDTTYSGTLH